MRQIDDAGRLRFSATRAESGAMLSVLSDTTDRGGTGRGFAAFTGLGAAGAGLDSAGVRRDVLADPTALDGFVALRNSTLRGAS